MAKTRGEPERLIARGGTELWIKGADDFYDVQHGQEITLVRARDYDALRVERDALKVELRTARKERDSAHEGWEHNQMARWQAERERDEVIAACRGTQMDDAAIVSMQSYVSEKCAIQDERNTLLAERDRMRAAGDALYESMDCQACRISSDFTFCAQCVADRERWRNLAPITARAAEGSP